MSKPDHNLPYFKFFVNVWNSGNIVDCSMQAQGLFINLCSLYWSRSGDLDTATAMRKLCHGNAKAYKELISNEIIKVSENKISIEFLDEQLVKAKIDSEKNREKALKRWKTDAGAMPQHSHGNASGMPIRQDNTRQEEIREEAAPTIAEYGDKTSKHFVLINPPYLNSRKYRLWGVKGVEEFLEANSSQLNRKEHAEKFLREKHGVPFNDMGHLINSYNAFIDKQFK